MRYIFVGEKWRRSSKNIDYSAIILGLALKQQESEGVKASICLARTDNASSRLCQRFGMLPVGEGVFMHNVRVAQMVNTEASPYPNKFINQCIDSLWESRMDYTKQPIKEEVYVKPRKRVHGQSRLNL